MRFGAFFFGACFFALLPAPFFALFSFGALFRAAFAAFFEGLAAFFTAFFLAAAALRGAALPAPPDEPTRLGECRALASFSAWSCPHDCPCGVLKPQIHQSRSYLATVDPLLVRQLARRSARSR